MAVIVQEMVDSDRSGVLFTVDPVHGRRDRMVVEAARGLGEAVVSGEVTPDNYTLGRDGVVKKSRVVGAERVLSDADCAALAGWDGGWPTCTEARRTSSGRSTPTAACSCCSRVPSPRSRSGR